MSFALDCVLGWELMVDWDLEAGYDYLLNEYEFIDPDRTVALGASYGGYMVTISFPSTRFHTVIPECSTEGR